MRRQTTATLPTILAVSATLILCCSRAGEDTSAPTPFEPIDENVDITGKTWLYEQTVRVPGIVEHTPTMQAFVLVSCERDTTILGQKYFVLVEEYLERGQLDVDTSSVTYYVHLGNDSVMFLLADTSLRYYPIVPLYKRAAANRSFMTADSIRDRYCALVLPLADTSSWYLRPFVDRGFNVRRRYVGRDTITVPAGEFECCRIEWDWSETWIDATDLMQTDWISTHGLIRTTFDGGTHTFWNSWGDSIATVDFSSTTSLVSCAGSMPSSIGPMLAPSLIDTLKSTVNRSWSLSNYRKWLDKHIEANDISTIDELHAAGVYCAEFLLESIFGDSLTTLDAILADLSKPLPLQEEDFHDYNQFLRIAVWQYEMIPGWDDCDLDITSGETERGPVFRFGKSEIRRQLMQTLYE